MLKKIYKNLPPANVVQVARHPNRPQTIDYINSFVKDFTELHGDQAYGDDQAMLAALAAVLQGARPRPQQGQGHQGQDRAFRHAHPEGYRKALRCMKLAEKYGLPL